MIRSTAYVRLPDIAKGERLTMHTTRVCPAALAGLALAAPSLRAATPGITLVGRGQVDGTALDKSGLTGSICQASNPSNCVPKTIFGGFGSNLAYTGHDDVFIAA